MQEQTISDYLVSKARVSLTHWMIAQAHKTSGQLGFGYVEDDCAPDTYAELLAAWANSERTKQALPVSTAGCDQTLYTLREGNWAFRFVHDAAHVMLKANFSPAGEARVFQYLGKKVATYFGVDSWEYKLYAADTIGQLAYFEIHQDYPLDQLAFVLSILRVV